MKDGFLQYILDFGPWIIAFEKFFWWECVERAKLESAYSFTLKYSKITVCHVVGKNKAKNGRKTDFCQ